MTKRTIYEVTVDDIEKRRFPSKYYVYVVQVTWSDGLVQIIYRRYSDFFDLQSMLLDSFPEEGGRKNPANRTIPFLPGKILFGRSQIRQVALQRLEAINDYCKALIQLPSHISDSHDVITFFEPRGEDLLAKHDESLSKLKKPGDIKSISDPHLCDQYICISDYEATEKQSVSMRPGELVDVVEKNENGWWFVGCESGQGWVPSSYLERADGDNDDRTVSTTNLDLSRPFVCLQDYESVESDELSIVKGTLVTVVETNLDGWWLADYKGKMGRVPGCYLTRSDTLKTERLLKTQSQSPLESGGNMSKPLAPRRPSQGPLSLTRVGSADDILNPSNDIYVNTKPTTPPPTKSKFGRAQNMLPGMSNGSHGFGGIFQRSRPGVSSDNARPPPRRSTIKRSKATLEIQEEPIYMAVADFKEHVSGGAAIATDDKLEVLDKSESGWWLVKTPNGEEGWVPSSHIEKKRPTPSSSHKPAQPPAPPKKPKGGSAMSNTASLQSSTAPHTPSEEPKFLGHTSGYRDIITPVGHNAPNPDSPRSSRALEVVSGIKHDIAGKFSKVIARLSPNTSPKSKRKDGGGGLKSKVAISGPVSDSAVDMNTGRSPDVVHDSVAVGAGWTHTKNVQDNYCEAALVVGTDKDNDDDDDEDAYDYEKVDEEDNVYANVESSGFGDVSGVGPPPLPNRTNKPHLTTSPPRVGAPSEGVPGSALASALTRFNDQAPAPPQPPSAAKKPHFSSQPSDPVRHDESHQNNTDPPKPPSAFNKPKLKPAVERATKTSGVSAKVEVHKPSPISRPAWARQIEEASPQINQSVKPGAPLMKPNPTSSKPQVPALPNKPKPAAVDLKPQTSFSKPNAEGSNVKVSGVRSKFQSQISDNMKASTPSGHSDQPAFSQYKLKPVAQNTSTKPQGSTSNGKPSAVKAPVRAPRTAKAPPFPKPSSSGIKSSPASAANQRGGHKDIASAANQRGGQKDFAAQGGVNALKNVFEK